MSYLVEPGQERKLASLNCEVSFSVYVTLDRKCSEHIPAVVDAEIKELICESTRDDDTVIYLDRLTVYYKSYVWVFIVNSKGNSQQSQRYFCFNDGNYGFDKSSEQ